MGILLIREGLKIMLPKSISSHFKLSQTNLFFLYMGGGGGHPDLSGLVGGNLGHRWVFEKEKGEGF